MGMTRLRMWTALALAACGLLPAAASAYAIPGTRVQVEDGGTFSAGELSAFPGGRVLPRNAEPKKEKDKEGSPRNVEKPGPKKQNPHAPRTADGGVARDVKPSLSLASPLGFDGPN